MTKKTLRLKWLEEIEFKWNFKLNKSELTSIEIKNSIIDILSVSKVPDVHRYDLYFENWYWVISELTKKHIKKSKFNDWPIEKIFDDKIKTIVLLLESPHKDEYLYIGKSGELNQRSKDFSIKNIEKIVPISPAQWSTWLKIFKHFDKLFFEISDNLNSLYKYRILIVNPIPFQTSLFSLHGKSLKWTYATLRNHVWETIWMDDKIKNDFLKRLDNYKVDILVNACTAKVKHHINNILKNQGYSFIYTEINHPESWNLD